MSKENLFTASDVATFCGVDLKTIHNWADRGHIRHFRTPGRHLRFTPEDVAAFIKKSGFPMPKGLESVQPAVDAPDVVPMRRVTKGKTAPALPATGPRAHVTDVFDDGSVTLTVLASDLPAFRALEGRDVVLAIAPAAGAAA
jgi:excisionase family DNA binding protein